MADEILKGIFLNDPMCNLYGLVQERRDSIANALELLLSCTNPSIQYSVQNGLTFCRQNLQTQNKSKHLIFFISNLSDVCS